jgi:rhodanese-related sulfurtransferase
MSAMVDARTLSEWLHDGLEIALLDMREHGQYGESHLFFGVSLPYSRLELEAPRLVPRKATRIVVYDDGKLGVAERAAERLSQIGYTNLRVLEGGTGAWKRAGFNLYAGVNVPSKTFGELVEHACHTPRVSAAQLAAMQKSGTELVLLDGRPVAEFRKMSIPGARCCPNGELAYRIAGIVRDPATPIVVNCAGRTRSIIGAQTLIDFGIPNPVYALENGTQGWSLADLPLEHGATRSYPEISSSSDMGEARARAKALADRHGVPFVDDAEVERWLADPGRTTYLCDVRTPEEFAAGTLEGAINAPGGQLLQATDQWIGVRHARIVLVDGETVRAPVIASWLVRMGLDACVLRAGVASRVRGAVQPPPLPDVPQLAVAELDRLVDSKSAAVVDLRPSMAYRKAHIPGSLWSIRPRLGELVPSLKRKQVVLVADEPAIAQIAARDLMEAGVDRVWLLAGGIATWRAGDGAIEATPRLPSDADCIDYLFFVHDRHEGNKDAARRYLAWETQLVSQLDPLERASFRLRAAPGSAR